MRATWAPVGRTPVLRHRGRWDKMSMSAALAYRPWGAEAALVFACKKGAYDTDSLIGFLEDLHEHFGSDKLTLIWDGLPSHRSKAMVAWLARQRSWLVVERLPAYAPELNPVEKLWADLKGTELANFCPDDTAQAQAAVEHGLTRIGTDRQLSFSFLRAAGLSL